MMLMIIMKYNDFSKLTPVKWFYKMAQKGTDGKYNFETHSASIVVGV